MFPKSRKIRLTEAAFEESDNFRFRSRTETELKAREEVLVEVTDLLNELGAPYFLADGTLLGAVRNSDFIPWDDDVGLCMKHEDYQAFRERMTVALASRDFQVEEGPKQNPKLNIFKNSEKIELTSWRLRGKYRVRWGLQMPSHLLDTASSVELRGRTYPCPSSAEEYLDHRYGDWKIPRVGRGTHSPSIKTPWSKIKKKIRRMSPYWLLSALGRDFLPK